MFKLTQSPTFKAPVRFSIQGEDGKAQEGGFTGIFKRHTQEEVDALLAESPSDDETVSRTLLGWADVADDAGEPLPFSKENLGKLLGAIHGSRKVIARTFFEFNSTATLKNV